MTQASAVTNQKSYWLGLIDDVRIYDEVLSNEEVAELAC